MSGVFAITKSKFFTVYVLTYNSDPQKLKITLESILEQDFGDFEVLISDDGSSKKDHFDVIREYVRKFKCVKVISHPSNTGTVKNKLHALEQANGELRLGLSPGDLLYSSNTISSLVEFYEKNDPLFFVGYFRAYALKKKGIIQNIDFMAPSPDQIGFLKKPNSSFNRLLFANYISGASLVETKKLQSINTLRIPEGVKYLEDHPFFLMAAYHGYSIPIYEKFIRWYEYGSGISTSQNKIWSQRLSEDLRFFLKWLSANGTCIDKNKQIERELEFLEMSNKIESTPRFIRKIHKLLWCVMHNPQRLLYHLSSKTPLLSPKNAEHRKKLLEMQGKGFLDDEAFLKEVSSS